MSCARCGTWLPPADRGFACSRPAAPSARSLPSAIIDAATTFLRGAAQAGLLRDDAAAVVRAVLEDADHLGPFAEKARNWAILTASNLGISMLLVLGATARAYENATGAVEPLEVARRIERIVLQNEARLRQLFAHLPDDIRNELQMAIDAIRASAAGRACSLGTALAWRGAGGDRPVPGDRSPDRAARAAPQADAR